MPAAGRAARGPPTLVHHLGRRGALVRPQLRRAAQAAVQHGAEAVGAAPNEQLARQVDQEAAPAAAHRGCRGGGWHPVRRTARDTIRHMPALANAGIRMVSFGPVLRVSTWRCHKRSSLKQRLRQRPCPVVQPTHLCTPHCPQPRTWGRGTASPGARSRAAAPPRAARGTAATLPCGARPGTRARGSAAASGVSAGRGGSEGDAWECKGFVCAPCEPAAALCSRNRERWHTSQPRPRGCGLGPLSKASCHGRAVPQQRWGRTPATAGAGT